MYKLQVKTHSYAPAKHVQNCRKTSLFRGEAWRGDDCARRGMVGLRQPQAREGAHYMGNGREGG